MARTDTAGHDAAPQAQSGSLVGQILDGRYRILRKLGEGAMGEVYAAEHVAIGKKFAIKLLHPETVSNPEALTRLFQRARSASLITHRNIVEIIDFGQLTDGRVYLSMELLEGAPLGDLTTQPIGVDRLLNILLQAGQGLAAAHARGIIHRDLRPENIFVTTGPRGEDVPKLLDLGIAKVPGDDRNATRAGTISGTPSYLAPEQAMGRPVDARTDVYALGAIMYECFTGTLPFQGDSFMDILTQQITTEPEPVAQRAARAGRQLPPGLAETITRCLQKDPAQRFQTMDELVTALSQIPHGVVGSGGTADARANTEARARRDTAERARLEAIARANAEAYRADASARAKAEVELAARELKARPGGLERADSPGVLVDLGAQPPPLVLDENVQFTVYRPRAIAPARWYSLLAFAHLAERRPGELDAPDPVDEVRRQAEAVLGERAAAYQSNTQDSGAAIPADGELVFVVEIPGVEVNPPRRSFLWTEPVHREEFRIRAGSQVAGTTARGRLTVFLGCIVIAELPLAMRVDAAPATAAVEHTQVRPYRKIFASYSHRDRVIVDQFERYARALGDEYLRDSIQLRSGEVWNDRLLQMIDQADAFQLFWSHNSMRSPYVRQEYEHALSLGRPSFVRPTYWEDPMPTAEGLPPESLRRLHFQKLGGFAEDPQPANEGYSARPPVAAGGSGSVSGPPRVPTSTGGSGAGARGIPGIPLDMPPLDLPPRKVVPPRPPTIDPQTMGSPLEAAPPRPQSIPPPPQFSPLEDPRPKAGASRWLALAAVLALLILGALLRWML